MVLNVGGHRPSLIICDDIYSEDNVKTEYSRTQVRKWFFNAVINSLDSHNGKMLLLVKDLLKQHYKDNDTF